MYSSQKTMNHFFGILRQFGTENHEGQYKITDFCQNVPVYGFTADNFFFQQLTLVCHSME